MKKLLALLCSAFCMTAATAQDLNIKDDTIKVSSSAFPMLSFMGEIRDYNTLCADYKLAASTTTLTIRPAASKPVKMCRLIVSEGSKNSPRQHHFVLVFDKEADPAEQIHDYSTKDLIQQRIVYLAKAREGAGGSDEEEEKPKKKKKKQREETDEPKQEKAKEVAEAEEDEPAPQEKPRKQTKPAKAKEVAVVEEEKPAPQEKPRKQARPVKEAEESEDSQGNGEELTIKDIPQEQLQARVKQKINAFYRACENLCAKIDVDGTVKYGMKLFNNDEDVIVGTVNSKTKASRPQKIRQYFLHLAQLSYKKVEMTASDIRFVSNFHKGPDGNWHASAVIIQDFKGYKDYNILAYKDQTSKTVDIIIKMTEEVKDGKTIQKFDIFLGNISVTNVPA